MISRSSWAKGRAWAEALPDNVIAIRRLELPDGRIRLFGEVRNSRGGYQTATAVVDSSFTRLFEYDGGTVLEDGQRVPATYHVAALIWAAKQQVR